MIKLCFILCLGWGLIGSAAPSPTQIEAAQHNFESFKNCQPDGSFGKNEKDLLTCMRKYLTKEAAKALALSYEFLFDSKMKLGPAMVCEPKQQALIEKMETQKFTLNLCFSTDYVHPAKMGVVFFQLEGSSLRISQIKL